MACGVAGGEGAELVKEEEAPRGWEVALAPPEVWVLKAAPLLSVPPPVTSFLTQVHRSWGQASASGWEPPGWEMRGRTRARGSGAGGAAMRQEGGASP